MPVALFAAALTAITPAAFGASIIGGISINTILAGGLSMAASIGLQSALTPSPKQKTQQGQIAARDANPVRMRGYGRQKMAGPTVYLGSNVGYAAYEMTVHCEGPIDGYEEWWANDAKTNIPAESLGGFLGIYPYVAAVHFESSLGAPDQPANAQLLATFPGAWTADHKLSGLAWTLNVAVLPPKAYKTFQDVYPNGRPGAYVVARLSKVLDVRDGVTRWTRNPALCIRDFLTHGRTNQLTGRTWRYIQPERIDVDSFKAFAGVCDENIPLADGGTEKRYSLDGLYDVATPPREIVRRMLAACDAELVLSAGGTVGIRGGTWEEPTVTLTEADLISYRYQQGNGKLSAFNRLQWKFRDPLNDYQLIQGDPWEDEESQAAIEEVRTKDIDLEWVTSHSQGRRLCKIITAKENPRHILSNVIAKLPALRLYGHRVVRVTLSHVEVDEVFLIKRFVPSDDLTTVSLDLASISADAYQWNPVAEEGTRPSSADPVDTSFEADVPEGVELSLVRTLLSQSSYGVRVRVSVDPPGGPFADQFMLLARIRPETGTDDDYVTMREEFQTGAISDFVNDGETYRVQVAWTALGYQSAWSAPQSIVAAAGDAPIIAEIGELGEQVNSLGDDVSSLNDRVTDLETP